MQHIEQEHDIGRGGIDGQDIPIFEADARMFRGATLRPTNFVVVIIDSKASALVAAVSQPMGAHAVAATEIEDESSARYQAIQKREHRILLHLPVNELLDKNSLIAVQAFDLSPQHAVRVHLLQQAIQFVANQFLTMTEQGKASLAVI